MTYRAKTLEGQQRILRAHAVSLGLLIFADLKRFVRWLAYYEIPRSK